MRRGWIAYLLLLTAVPAAFGTSVSTRPRPAFLLRTGSFVTQDGPATVTVYDRSGSVVHRFVTGPVVAVDVSLDERHVAVSCGDGTVLVGDLQRGTTVWSKPAARSSLRRGGDVSFAAGGTSLIVCDDQDQAIVFDTSTGTPIGAVRFPPMQANIVSAALSPDGTRGVLVELGEHVFTFDVSSGALHDTGVTGAWPVRFTDDGRYFALRSANSGMSEQLRVVDAADTSRRFDLGEFARIGRIRPMPGGVLSVTASVEDAVSRAWHAVGATCDPGTRELRTAWEARPGSAADRETDFDLQTMLGVSTDYRFVTSLVDLRADAPRLTIDNSANFRVDDGGRAFVGLDVLAAAVVAAALLLVVVRRGVRRASR